MSDEQQTAPAAHWRRRARGTPIPRDQAARQGYITTLAFQILGKDRAIAFLNTDDARLGGRPIALATESRAGQLHIEAELGRLRESQTTQP
jgi:hypothetical protein